MSVEVIPYAGPLHIRFPEKIFTGSSVFAGDEERRLRGSQGVLNVAKPVARLAISGSGRYGRQLIDALDAVVKPQGLHQRVLYLAGGDYYLSEPGNKTRLRGENTPMVLGQSSPYPYECAVVLAGAPQQCELPTGQGRYNQLTIAELPYGLGGGYVYAVEEDDSQRGVAMRTLIEHFAAQLDK